MLPRLEGVIVRRLLLNFWADPIVVRRLIPVGVELTTMQGHGVVGVCLVRLEHIRPKGMPAFFGVAAESMEHCVAIRYRAEQGWHDGVFVWRRETDCPLLVQLGGRLFPGVHRPAEFCIGETPAGLTFDVRSESGDTDVSLSALRADVWPGTLLFPQMDDASAFFERSECGFSCSRDDHSLEPIRPDAFRWESVPLRMESVHAAFYADPRRFPPGSIGFDGALLLRNSEHEWRGVGLPQREATQARPETRPAEHP